GVKGQRRKFAGVVGDASVRRIVVEHRDRLCRFGSEYVQAALAAQGRELVVVDSAEVDNDLVRDMTEIVTSMCALGSMSSGQSRTGLSAHSQRPRPRIVRLPDGEVRGS